MQKLYFYGIRAAHHSWISDSLQQRSHQMLREKEISNTIL